MKKNNDLLNNPKQLGIFSEPAVAYCAGQKPVISSLVDAACKKALKML